MAEFDGFGGDCEQRKAPNQHHLSMGPCNVDQFAMKANIYVWLCLIYAYVQYIYSNLNEKHSIMKQGEWEKLFN